MSNLGKIRISPLRATCDDAKHRDNVHILLMDGAVSAQQGWPHRKDTGICINKAVQWSDDNLISEQPIFNCYSCGSKKQNKTTLLANSIVPTLYACVCLYRSTGKNLVRSDLKTVMFVSEGNLQRVPSFPAFVTTAWHRSCCYKNKHLHIIEWISKWVSAEMLLIVKLLHWG